MKYLIVSMAALFCSIYQNCGPVNFNTSSGVVTSGTVTALGNGTSSTISNDPTSAPEQMALICQFEGLNKIDWDSTPIDQTSSNITILNQSSGADITSANLVDIENSSGSEFLIGRAEELKAFTANSGHLVANARNVCSIHNDSGSIDLNSTNVGDVSASSSNHICITAHTVKSISNSSSGNIAISSVGSPGSIPQISGSSGKLVLINMNVGSISSGSGNIYAQDGHISLISGVSGSIYLDHVTVDEIKSSSGKVVLLNGAQVLVTD